MLIWIAKRCIHLIPVLWGVGTLTFLLLHLVPGDPVDILLGDSALPASREALREKLHLDKPLTEQYFIYWRGVLRGDLGESISQRKPVLGLVKERLPATIALALVSLACATLIAIPLGVFLAAVRNSFTDHTFLILTLAGVSLPSFWLGPLLIILFSVNLGWLPVSGRESLASIILPVMTLSLVLSAFLVRITRASMLEVLREEYINVAFSKGLSSFTVYGKHALKNAFLPILTILGLQLGNLLSGAVVIETIFDWPGLGDLLFQGIQARDYVLVQACVLVIATIYVSVNSLVDIFYGWLNPRMRIS